jgi:WXXGXW repeat (2 copies)
LLETLGSSIRKLLYQEVQGDFYMIRVSKLAGLLLFIALATLTLPSPSPAQVAVGISIHIGPPALPVYPQPVCPAPGYIWAPGYWAYGPYGYFWVPGTWVLAPTPGFLWTPGYWGFVGGAYVWHGGYWGPHVGFYGGINYGFGYTGVGFVGGEWRGGIFHYNTAVTNVNTTIIHNTYVNNTVINRTVVNNVSYNGGAGGTTVQPTAAERAAMNEHHIQATSLQTQHEQMARNDRTMLASANHGHPAVAATPRPGVFKGEGVVSAHAAAVNNNRPNSGSNTEHMDRPPSARNSNSYTSTNNHPGNTNSYQAHTDTNRPNTSQSSASHPNNSYHPNGGNENNHPNTSHPPQNENRPPEHESHPAHEGSGHGR